jgi:transposase, IS5 family
LNGTVESEIRKSPALLCHPAPAAKSPIRATKPHDYAKKERVFIAGQRRGLTPSIKRELRRRSAIEPMIGHMKEDGRLGRNHLLGIAGDAMNALLVAAGHNLRLILNWLRLFVAWLMAALISSFAQPDTSQVA